MWALRVILMVVVIFVMAIVQTPTFVVLIIFCYGYKPNNIILPYFRIAQIWLQPIFGSICQGIKPNEPTLSLDLLCFLSHASQRHYMSLHPKGVIFMVDNRREHVLRVKIFLDKEILNNVPASISRRYIRPLLHILKNKQEANYKPQSLLLNCHPFRAKMSIAVTSKARHASAIKPLSSTFCKIAHVLVR